jgi:hypothetical protein
MNADSRSLSNEKRFFYFFDFCILSGLETDGLKNH